MFLKHFQEIKIIFKKYLRTFLVFKLKFKICFHYNYKYIKNKSSLTCLSGVLYLLYLLLNATFDNHILINEVVISLLIFVVNSIVTKLLYKSNIDDVTRYFNN